MPRRRPSLILGRKELLPFELGYLPEQFQKKAEVELNDNPENREQGLKEMRELIQKDKITRSFDFEDDFLLQYLRVRKFNVAKSFSQLRAFANLRKKNPDMFSDLRFESLSTSMSNKFMSILPWRCEDGCTIGLVELDNWNPDEFPIEELKKAVVVFLLQSMREVMTQVNGYKVILDMKSNPLKHLRYCTPSNLHLLYQGIEECSPGRYKSIHIVNTSLTFRAAWVIIKAFFSEKIKQRIHFHSSSKELLNFFPRELLPMHYGGILEKYDNVEWLKRAMQPECLATMGGSPRRRRSSCPNT